MKTESSELLDVLREAYVFGKESQSHACTWSILISVFLMTLFSMISSTVILKV
jgi:hypothetical protein